MASFKCSECVAKCVCKVQKFDPLCDEFRKKLADTVEGQKPSHNNAMVQCKCHSAGAICHRPIKCGGIPCLLPSTAPIAEPLYNITKGLNNGNNL